MQDLTLTVNSWPQASKISKEQLLTSKKDLNWSYTASKLLRTFWLICFPSKMSPNTFEINENKINKLDASAVKRLMSHFDFEWKFFPIFCFLRFLYFFFFRWIGLFFFALGSFVFVNGYGCIGFVVMKISSCRCGCLCVAVCIVVCVYLLIMGWSVCLCAHFRVSGTCLLCSICVCVVLRVGGLVLWMTCVYGVFRVVPPR